jgi:hypothetical protein
MTADQLFRLINFVCNKNQNGGLTPTEFGLVASAAQRQYIAFLLGNFEKYTPGRPIANVELGNNLAVRQRLKPVIKKATLAIVAGEADYPPDFIQVDAMFKSDAVTKIRYADQFKLDGIYDSGIDPVATNPIYLLENTKVKFYPSSLSSAVLSYVSNPADIVWGSTTDGNGRKIYASGSSTHPVFDDIGMMEVAARALKMVGVNLQAGQVMQYANDLEKSGQ